MNIMSVCPICSKKNYGNKEYCINCRSYLVISESIDKPISESIDKPISESIDKPISESIDKPISESIDKPISIVKAQILDKKNIKIQLKIAKYNMLLYNSLYIVNIVTSNCTNLLNWFLKKLLNTKYGRNQIIIFMENKTVQHMDYLNDEKIYLKNKMKNTA